MRKNSHNINSTYKYILIILLLFLYQNSIESRPICEPEEPCSLCGLYPTDCLFCIEGYFLIGNECVSCKSPCKVCESLTSCLSK